MITNKLNSPVVYALQWTLCATALSACGFLTAGTKTLSQLHQGMTPAQVQAIAGAPSQRSVKENGEELWSYYYPYESMSLYLKFREGQLSAFGSNGPAVDPSFTPPPPPPVQEPPVVIVDRPGYPQRPLYPQRPGEIITREAEQRAFEEFCLSLRRIRYDEERREALREVIPFSYFSVYQGIRLLELFPEDHDRLIILADLADHLIDPQNARGLLACFEHMRSRQEAERILSNILLRPNPGIYGRYERQMQQDFERFYRAVKEQIFPDDQMRYLEVGASERLFTVEQAKRLISLFMWKDSKLKALRLLAPNLLDGYNAYQLLDCFDMFDKEDAQRVLRLSQQRPRYLRPSGYGTRGGIFD